jgi:succinate dehydrogenase/fumarate reductase flavoprotein subunit
LQDRSDAGEETSVDNIWSHIAKLYTDSSIKKLGHRKRNTNKEWIQQEIQITIENKKEIKRKNKQLQIKSPRLLERQEEVYTIQGS